MQRKFGFATHARQTWAIAAASLGTIAKSAAGVVAAIVAVLVVVLMPVVVGLKGVSLIPRTAQVLSVLTAPVADNSRLPWVLIPLLIVFYAGELVWRERDAGLSEITDATPVPEWVLFLGKFLGLSLVLLGWMALAAMAGVLGQMRMGYFAPEIGLYLRALFGLQLIDYLLFALLVFVIHVVVNQKQVGYLVALIAYAAIALPSTFGLEHNLLIYGSGPKWTYSDMRGFGASLGPWLWFKLYWTAWAVLLAVAGMLLWPRGRSTRVASLRFTRATVAVAAAAVVLIVTLGGFIFYNTNSLNRYRTASEETERRAEYERRYGKYAGIAQPRLTSTSLRIEIYPDRREVEIRGSYVLANTSTVAIDSLHVTTVPGVETGSFSLGKPVLIDDDLGYRIYALGKPLQPGDSLRLGFAVHVKPHGFANRGADASVVLNGSHFTNRDWLPAIGYQQDRELDAAGVRKQYGLARRPVVPSLDDMEARRIRVGGDMINFEAIIGTNAGTSGDQLAVAPGVLRRTWTEQGRRYFHYVSDAPINNRYDIFSAAYAVHEEQWKSSATPEQSVAIQIFHHPGHAATVGGMAASVRAALDRYTRQFGPYTHSYIRLIENPSGGMGVQTEAATIKYGEGFSLLKPGPLNPHNGPDDPNPVFAVVAHAVARDWWGMQLPAADVEGSGLLGVSLEAYSAMRVVEDTFGPENLRRYVETLHEQSDAPRRAAPPLLRATDSAAISRKGPFALYTLSRYIGAEKVDEALRQLLEKHRTGTAPLPISLDLYRELQAVTPDSFQYLLRDLFEKNTFWELAMERASAKQTSADAWQVTLEVRARKVVVDEAGIETEAPMDDWVEVAVFGEGERYVEKHRIRSGLQTITVTVPRKPTRAGIDPENLLIDLDTDDNVKDVRIER